MLFDNYTRLRIVSWLKVDTFGHLVIFSCGEMLLVVLSMLWDKIFITSSYRALSMVAVNEECFGSNY